MAERDPIDELELKVAIAASEERARHEVGQLLRELKDDIGARIRLWCGLGILSGNVVAAYVSAKVGAGEVPAVALRAVRSVLPL